MFKNNLGYPRVGTQRQLKKACEQYWAGKQTEEQLFETALQIQKANWQVQLEADIDFIPCNDFSFYDHVLDMSLLVGAIPRRYTSILNDVKESTELDLYFAMARGYQKDGLDITAMEMTKWFDTNYHYIVPEFTKNQHFQVYSNKLFETFIYAQKHLGTKAKPVLIGPISYLLLGKEKDTDFAKIDLIYSLLPTYIDILTRLQSAGANWIQLDEPFLAMDLTEKEQKAYQYAYAEIRERCPDLKILLTSYFEALENNTELALNLPVDALHIDLVKAPEQLKRVLDTIPEKLLLSLGVIDGRNIWKNDYKKSLSLIETTISTLGEERVMIAPSCSLVHTPFDLDLEFQLHPEIKNWMAFAKQKLNELSELDQILKGNTTLLDVNQQAIQGKKSSLRIHRPEIKQRVADLNDTHFQRSCPFTIRQQKQQEKLSLPLFPTTTIGSFPQTNDIRQLRAELKKGSITNDQYDKQIEQAIANVVHWQEEIGLDVLVHGEFERNDMVEYFGELLEGFLITQNGWVQSYGSRCVKPPVIYGDVNRPKDMTVRWSSFAQSQTTKPMKGMLTGPVTILQWSFVRDDQPRSITAKQIALAIRDEVCALEKADIKIIQIDEPAIREGLPLRRKNWNSYLDWAIKAFRVATSGVQDETQIHTHMCYSEFNDIINHIAAMDADVITIETLCRPEKG